MNENQTPMKRLTLVRHGAAEQGSEHDIERALTLAGRADAAKLGERLVEAGIRPDHVLCSTAVRARQTWELVANAYGEAAQGIQVQYLEGLYGADIEEMLALIGGLDEKYVDVLVVGHEPVSSAFAHFLAGPSSQESAALRVRSGLSTATAALLTYKGPWHRLERHGAVLTALATPRS